MIGHAFTCRRQLSPRSTYESVDLMCGYDVQAARIQLISERPNGVELSHGWVVRTEDGADEVAIGRTLHPAGSPWTRTAQSPVAITGPGVSFRFEEWLAGGLRLSATTDVRGDGQTIVATLFTEGNFAIRHAWDDPPPTWNPVGEERFAVVGDLLYIGGDGYGVISAVRDTVPVTGGWGLFDGTLTAGLQVVTDWGVVYRPIRLSQAVHQDLIDSPDPRGCVPDLVTLVQGAVDLPYDEVDEGQSGCSLGLSSATYADQAMSSIGYSMVSGQNEPESRGWTSHGQISHRLRPGKQVVVGKQVGWINDGFKLELDSLIKANWLAALWYAPTPITQRAEHEGVAGALR